MMAKNRLRGPDKNPEVNTCTTLSPSASGSSSPTHFSRTHNGASPGGMAMMRMYRDCWVMGRRVFVYRTPNRRAVGRISIEASYACPKGTSAATSVPPDLKNFYGSLSDNEKTTRWAHSGSTLPHSSARVVASIGRTPCGIASLIALSVAAVWRAGHWLLSVQAGPGPKFAY